MYIAVVISWTRLIVFKVSALFCSYVQQELRVETDFNLKNLALFYNMSQNGLFKRCCCREAFTI